ncbi:MAG: halocyanin, partial [Actinobacteria bacterium]|nr:halocyanin [Actinomycetota bacterium]
MRTRWIAPALVGVAAALAVGPPVGAETGGAVREVAMPGKAYVPHELDVLLGDTVVWKNQDMGSHTVTAGDD